MCRCKMKPWDASNGSEYYYIYIIIIILYLVCNYLECNLGEVDTLPTGLYPLT